MLEFIIYFFKFQKYLDIHGIMTNGLSCREYSQSYYKI